MPGTEAQVKRGGPVSPPGVAPHLQRIGRYPPSNFLNNGMNLSVDELRQLLYCCGAELRARRVGKPPGPQPWLAKLIRRLELDGW